MHAGVASGKVLLLGMPYSLLCCCAEAVNSAVGRVPLSQIQGVEKESSGERPWPELFKCNHSRNVSMAEITV